MKRGDPVWLMNERGAIVEAEFVCDNTYFSTPVVQVCFAGKVLKVPAGNVIPRDLEEEETRGPDCTTFNVEGR